MYRSLRIAVLICPAIIAWAGETLSGSFLKHTDHSSKCCKWSARLIGDQLRMKALSWWPIYMNFHYNVILSTEPTVDLIAGLAYRLSRWNRKIKFLCAISQTKLFCLSPREQWLKVIFSFTFLWTRKPQLSMISSPSKFVLNCLDILSFERRK